MAALGSGMMLGPTTVDARWSSSGICGVVVGQRRCSLGSTHRRAFLTGSEAAFTFRRPERARLRKPAASGTGAHGPRDWLLACLCLALSVLSCTHRIACDKGTDRSASNEQPARTRLKSSRIRGRGGAGMMRLIVLLILIPTTLLAGAAVSATTPGWPRSALSALGCCLPHR